MPTDPLRSKQPLCRFCREPLALERRHTSPKHLGEVLVTETWSCPRCDARFTYSPKDDRWRPVVS